MRFHFYLDLFHGAVQKAPQDPAKIACWGERRAVESTSMSVCKEGTGGDFLIEVLGESPQVTQSETVCVSSRQAKIGDSIEHPVFFRFLVNPREISRFCDIRKGIVLPCFEG